MAKGTYHETWPPDHPALATGVIVWIPTDRQRQMYREWKHRQAKQTQHPKELNNTQPGIDQAVTDSERAGEAGEWS